MIHHPENPHNGAITKQDLSDSIDLMRHFILNKLASGTM